jgi:hypothetical protein
MIDLEGPLSWFSTFGYRGVYIGKRARLDIKLVWFGYIARLSRWGGGREVIYLFKLFHLPSQRLEEGGGGVSTMWVESMRYIYIGRGRREAGGGQHYGALLKFGATVYVWRTFCIFDNAQNWRITPPN